jgi:hypothetical protein
MKAADTSKYRSIVSFAGSGKPVERGEPVKRYRNIPPRSAKEKRNDADTRVLQYDGFMTIYGFIPGSPIFKV